MPKLILEIDLTTFGPQPDEAAMATEISGLLYRYAEAVLDCIGEDTLPALTDLEGNPHGTVRMEE